MTSEWFRAASGSVARAALPKRGLGRASVGGLALVFVGASALLASGCGEVESCVETETGCLNGPPDDSGNCSFGLVPNVTGTACVKKAGGSSTPNKCNCTGGALCLADGTCSNLCVAPANLPAAKASPQPCTAPAGEAAFDFSTTAVALCSQICVHRQALCGATCDLGTDCTPAKALVIAAALKTSTSCLDSELACAAKACIDARDKPCAQQDCGVGHGAPDCAGVACSNNCVSASFNNDGICDDGDLSNAQSAVCNWGTDCGDCGPRRGAAPAFSVPIGGACVDPGQCGGDPDDIKGSKAWCVPTSSNAALPQRCVPDCSLTQQCQSGFECAVLASVPEGSASMAQVPVTDATGTTARACFPTQCGN